MQQVNDIIITSPVPTGSLRAEWPIKTCHKLRHDPSMMGLLEGGAHYLECMWCALFGIQVDALSRCLNIRRYQ